MSKRVVDRRYLLRGLGASAIALPLLQCMGCDQSGAAPGTSSRASRMETPPKRFIAVQIPNGVVPATWFPTGSEANFTLAQSMMPLDGSGLPGLSDYKSDLVVFKGIENQAAGRGVAESHFNSCTMLSGASTKGTKGKSEDWFAGGVSIDQLIVAQLEKERGSPFPIGSLQLGSEGARLIANLSFDERGQDLPNITSPNALFTRLFAGSSQSEAEQEALRLRRQSILDGVAGNYQRLMARVSSDDRQRLGAHLTAIRDVEKRLSATSSCKAPDPSAYPDIPGVSKEMPRFLDLMQDLLVLAMACDLTSVASFQYRRPGGGTSYYPWLGLADGTGLSGADQDKAYAEAEHHEMSHRVHDPAWDPTLTKVAQWLSGNTAALVKKLKATPYGNGTLFDGTLILQGSESATGQHNYDDMPFVLIGNAGGALRTGRYLQYPKQMAHNDLLLSILHLMGSSATTVGDADLCSGPLPSLV